MSSVSGQILADVLPADLYYRLQKHLEYVRTSMADWMSEEQKRKGLFDDYLFNAIAGNWQRKRPVWVMLMVNSLTEADVKSRGVPVLDLYLAQQAEREGKVTGAVERVEEQCLPLNDLDLSQYKRNKKKNSHVKDAVRKDTNTDKQKHNHGHRSKDVCDRGVIPAIGLLNPPPVSSDFDVGYSPIDCSESYDPVLIPTTSLLRSLYLGVISATSLLRTL
ncbi:metalloprotease tiki1 [Plakobranchus ocellatus]|uniref:Metalloprotease TIKI homolog n=1 Tax=Plakobranchus ocellatus TaxID=259542 RepID=A0AAV3ZQP9_9GAST|nr:metalloprotease tiki1 [Plakobranchus ocellatus]